MIRFLEIQGPNCREILHSPPPKATHPKKVKTRSRRRTCTRETKSFPFPLYTTSSQYSITRGVGNRRERRKTQVVNPVMDQAGCPGREPDCLKPAGTWVEVSARMYNDLNSLRDRAKEGCGSKCRHAGTGEGISARIHVANSHGDRAEGGRRSDRKHSANSLWERDESCMLVGASIDSQSRSEEFNRSWKLIVTKEKLRRERTISVAVTPLDRTLGRYPNAIFATCKRGGFVLQRATKTAKKLIAQNSPQDCL